MRALVVYESVYGNTHLIAEAIARGLRPAYAVQVVSVAEARYEHVGVGRQARDEAAVEP